jgi:MFS family permease
MGLLSAGGTFGVALGPLSITILMGFFNFSWRQLYQFWVPPIILGLIILYFVREVWREDSYREEHVEGDAISLISRDFLLYISSRGVRMFALSMVSAFLAITWMR